MTTIVRNDKLLQIFVELPKFAGSLEQVDNLGDPILEDVFKAADRLRMSMEEKENYMMSVLGEFEYYANIEEAREEAHEKGIEQGKAEEKLGTAKKLKAVGVDTSIIAECTGLEMEIILAL